MHKECVIWMLTHSFIVATQITPGDAQSHRCREGQAHSAEAALLPRGVRASGGLSSRSQYCQGAKYDVELMP